MEVDSVIVINFTGASHDYIYSFLNKACRSLRECGVTVFYQFRMDDKEIADNCCAQVFQITGNEHTDGSDNNEYRISSEMPDGDISEFVVCLD